MMKRAAVPVGHAAKVSPDSLEESGPGTRSAKRRRQHARAFFPLAALEPRHLLSVSASTILGPQSTGDTFVYAVSGITSGTLTRTFEPAPSFNGATIELDNSFQLTGGDSLVKDYYAFDSSGNYDFYGSTGPTGTITVPTPGILNPATQNANQTYTESFTEDFSNGTSAVVTHHLVLKSETPTAITVPAGTFLVYENDDTITTSGQSQSVLIKHFLSPTAGEVEFTQTVVGVTTTYALTSASGPGLGNSSDKLAFVQQPTAVAAGSSITPPVVVDVEDASGNLLTTDTSNVTLVLSAGGTLAGTTTVAAVNGVATFSDLQISAGGNYTLTASDGLLASATSSSFTVSGGVASNALAISVASSNLPASVVAGGTLKGKVSLLLSNTGNTTQSGTATVAVYASSDGTIDGSSILLGSAVASGSLKPFAHTTIPVNILSLPSSLNGTYSLFAQAVVNGTPILSAAGPTLTAAAPFVSLTESFIGLPTSASAVSGTKTKTVIVMSLTNHGNIQSKGNTTIAIYASPDGTVANGTLIRTLPSSVKINPGATVIARIPLLALPTLPNGSYFVVAQVTDPRADVTTVTSANSYTLAAPFISLVPSSALKVPGRAGSATLSFTLTNQGNSDANGGDTFAIVTSSTNSLADGTTIFSQMLPEHLPAGVGHTVRLKLTAAEVSDLTEATTAALEVTDSFGATQLLQL